MHTKKIIVIGGGPAGMMAAIRASQCGGSVTLIEKNAQLGRKLLLTGKGRCNLANACSVDAFLARFSDKKAAFLRDALKHFFHEELIDFLKERGVQCTVERQQRVFPARGTAEDVLDAFAKELIDSGVTVIYKCSARSITIGEDGAAQGVVCADGRTVSADAVIVATGGMSYAFTGSMGDGFKIAQHLGHHVVDPRPGLVALRTKQKFPKALSQITLKNIRLTFKGGKKEIVSPIGELSFMEFGISGALVLSVSGQIIDWLADKKKVTVSIDFKPALSAPQLTARFVKEFTASPKKSIVGVLRGFLPSQMIDVFIERAAIASDILAHQITHAERETLVALLKGMRLDVAGSLSIEEAMVTRGGVCLKEIHPRTMESRLVRGLYFAGEVIDVDGDTGGFNLQAAFSTGYLAGTAAAMKSYR